MPGAGADASAAGVIIVAPARGEASGVQIVAPAGEPGRAVVSAAASPGTAAPPEGSEQQSQQTAKAPSLQVGDQFTVTLLTPLAVSTAWQSVPAVAQGTQGPLSGWRVIGTASLGQDGSLQIAWTDAMSPDGKVAIKLHGVAYDPTVGKPGVPGAQTSVMAPQAARTMLSGVLAAVGQYVQDQLQAEQTQVAGLTATLTSQVPPFWQVLAQQLATGFQPGPVQTGGTVAVARLPAGAPVVIFITAPSG